MTVGAASCVWLRACVCSERRWRERRRRAADPIVTDAVVGNGGRSARCEKNGNPNVAKCGPSMHWGRGLWRRRIGNAAPTTVFVFTFYSRARPWFEFTQSVVVVAWYVRTSLSARPTSRSEINESMFWKNHQNRVSQAELSQLCVYRLPIVRSTWLLVSRSPTSCVTISIRGLTNLVIGLVATVEVLNYRCRLI